MQGHWSHDHAYYRCRYSNEYALANCGDRRAGSPGGCVVGVVAGVGGGRHEVDGVVEVVGQEHSGEPVVERGEDPAFAEVDVAGVVAECDAKLATHRAALEAGADPALITQWITETQAHRARAEAELHTVTKGQGPACHMTRSPASSAPSATSPPPYTRPSVPMDRARRPRRHPVRRPQRTETPRPAWPVWGGDTPDHPHLGTPSLRLRAHRSPP
ncbi:hypothetical protein [Streptomyces sp. NPDC056672]|uniref:hypothetical protein n=1 Tax=Streptomyces sp. NPDC056672 TaxID=3345906 RepID=UPI0036B087F7